MIWRTQIGPRRVGDGCRIIPNQLCLNLQGNGK